ncbi:hypothetical protein ID866_8256 [Astraeus odoratus]|nr:hypothetical protein ID866_8256 [Astraeus odoratus]
MEPEWEDCTEKAEERRQRALSVAVEFDGQWVRVTGCTISLPWPSVLVTEEIRLPSRMRSVPTHLQNAETLQTHGVTRPSPHEIKTSCVPIVPVQTIAHSSTTTPRSSRRRRRRKQVQKKPLPAYWRAPSDMRGKCMGYAMGYPGSWRYSGTPATAYVRDTMKRGVNA